MMMMMMMMMMIMMNNFISWLPPKKLADLPSE